MNKEITAPHMEEAAPQPLLPHPDAIAARGRELRQKVPRKSQAEWKRHKNREDPIEILRASDPERIPELVPIRYGRMLASPFAFYRGSAAVMASDLATTPSTGVQVQACGDCHLMNFGGFATPERNLIFDINDFDETHPAPWEWDVKRLVASLVLASRANGHSDDDARDAAAACARSYRERLRGYSKMSPLETWYARLSAEDFLSLVDPDRRAFIEKRIQQATEQSGSEMDFPKLADVVAGEIRIQDEYPLIYHPEITQAPGFEAAIDAVFSDYRESLSEHLRVVLDRYRWVDAAIKVVGIGSVGRNCWIALLMSAANSPLFLQFKEARASALEPFTAPSVYKHHGQRVVMGQRLMQPATDVFLGWVTGGPQRRQFYVRQLRDAKIKPLVETLDKRLMTIYGEACGWALARAHAKVGDSGLISGYLGRKELFDQAMGDFALAYADQAERDHSALKAAVRAGTIAVQTED
jgi:uncharacterized protein (DUF2252 family)